MSRTYRKRNEQEDIEWLLRNHEILEEITDFSIYERIVNAGHGWSCSNSKARTHVWAYYNKKSKQAKKLLANYHSDAYKKQREPGPMWFVREFTQVPYRMKCKTELANFKKYEDYEVILESMPHLDYWT